MPNILEGVDLDRQVVIPGSPEHTAMIAALDHRYQSPHDVAIAEDSLAYQALMDDIAQHFGHDNNTDQAA